MRFGERLQEASKGIGERDVELEKSVLDYSNLKKTLRGCVEVWKNTDKSTADTSSEESTNDPFWNELLCELKKLDAFYDSRMVTLLSKYNKLEQRVDSPTSSPGQLRQELKRLQKWVELNHVALVKIHKKYIKNAKKHQQQYSEEEGKLPVIFKRQFFEGDNKLARLVNQVDALYAAMSFDKKCNICQCTSPCDKLECQSLLTIITDVCHGLVPGWEESDLVIRILTGGLSNRLYTAHPSGSSNDKVVVRILGSGDIVDRKQEKIVSKALSQRGIGPKIFGEFPEGRVEEFVSGLALRFYHLCKEHVLTEVSRKLADFHKIDIDESIPRTPATFSMARRYLASAAKVSFTNGETQVVPGTSNISKKVLLEDVAFSQEQLTKEIDWLEELASNFTVSKIGFCHCDVQEGNILADDPKSEVPVITLIDFEYARYDYEAFDIGNFFCETYLDNFFPEYPYFRCHPQLLLSDELQRLFLTTYLTHRNNGEQPSSETVTAFQRETGVMMMASHLLWCLWSMIQANASDIEFCYLSYARIRLAEYFRMKEVFLASEEKRGDSPCRKS